MLDKEHNLKMLNKAAYDAEDAAEDARLAAEDALDKLNLARATWEEADQASWVAERAAWAARMGVEKAEDAAEDGENRE